MQPMYLQRAAVLFALIFSASAGTAAAEPTCRNCWPQWRGPTRNSVLKDVPAWPKDFTSLSQQWRVALGPSYSGPIVWGDRVFVTETEQAQDEVVRALERTTGRELWQARWSGSLSVPFFAKKNGDWIRSTPACDGESLFVAGMRDTLTCLDMESGAERWRIDFPARLETPVPSFGFVSSPLIVGDHLYVQAGGGFVKVDKRTGEIIWRTLVDGGEINSAFSSPIAATIHGVPQIVVQMREALAGVSPETGEVLWSQVVPSFRGMNILTPTVFANGIFTSSHKNRSFFYQVEKSDEGFKVSEAWTLKAQGYMSTPVVIDGLAYLHLGNRRLACIDLREGIERWRTESFGEYWSMIANHDRILALDQRGELLLIAADPAAFRLLDRREVAQSESWAHLAVAGEQVFVRDLQGITAFTWK